MQLDIKKFHKFLNQNIFSTNSVEFKTFFKLPAIAERYIFHLLFIAIHNLVVFKVIIDQRKEID